MPSVSFTETYSVSYWGSITAQVRLTFSETYNQAANTTQLALTSIEFKKNGTAVVGTIPVFGTVAIDGTTVCTIDNSGSGKTATVYLTGDGWCSANLSNVTKTPVTVTHNADGSKSVTVALSGGSLSRFCAQYAWYHQFSTTPEGHPLYRTDYVPFGVSVPASTTMALTTRPRISSVSCAGGNIGDALTITLTRYSSSFTHTVKTSCAGYTQTLMTKDSTYPTLSWTPAVATYAPRITTAMSATATITCETYNGSTLIGTATTTCTLTLKAADVKPSTSIATSDPTGNLSTYGKYVKGKSKVTVTLTNTLKYSATLASTTITANGATYNSSPATTDFIASTSNTSVTAKITDSRGQTSSTASTTIQIYDYAAPKINSFSVARCDSDGTLNNGGAYMRVNYNVTITALGNNNSKSLVIKYKKSSASSWSSKTVTLSSYSVSSNDHSIAADVNSTYNVKLELTDDFGTTTSSTKNLPTAATRMNFGSGENGGIGIGKVSETNKALEIAADWYLKIGGEQPFTITPTRFDLYGISTSGEQVNATIAQIFSAIPNYSRVIIAWTAGGNTSRFGTFSSELPGTNYGMFIMEKASSVAHCRFCTFNSKNTYIGNFSTVNSVGFSGWGLITVTAV